jgi:hypothetical protein
MNWDRGLLHHPPHDHLRVADLDGALHLAQEEDLPDPDLVGEVLLKPRLHPQEAGGRGGLGLDEFDDLPGPGHLVLDFRDGAVEVVRLLELRVDHLAVGFGRGLVVGPRHDSQAQKGRRGGAGAEEEDLLLHQVAPALEPLGQQLELVVPVHPRQGETQGDGHLAGRFGDALGLFGIVHHHGEIAEGLKHLHGDPEGRLEMILETLEPAAPARQEDPVEGQVLHLRLALAELDRRADQRRELARHAHEGLVDGLRVDVPGLENGRLRHGAVLALDLLGLREGHPQRFGDGRGEEIPPRRYIPGEDEDGIALDDHLGVSCAHVHDEGGLAGRGRALELEGLV